MRLFIDRLATPIGEILLVSDGEGHLRGLDWSDHEARLTRLLRLNYRPFAPEAGAAPAATRRALRPILGATSSDSPRFPGGRWARPSSRRSGRR